MDCKKPLVVGFLLLMAASAQTASAQGNPLVNSNAITLEQALAKFLTAFNNLDWEAFRTCFSETATIFHPAAPNIRRIDSPDQFDKAWLGVFDRIRKSSGRISPPFMDLRPRDLRIEKLSEDVGLVTFHLVDDTTVSRRTLIFKRYPDGWKIVHIHASNINVP